MKNQRTYDAASRELLIYDASCPICSGTAKWIRNNAIDGSFDLLPCQSVQEDTRNPGIKRSDCMQAMHLVLPGGTVLSGEQALAEIVTRLRKYHSAGILFKLPGIMTLTRITYRWFARRRYGLAALLSHVAAGRKLDS